MKKALKLTMLAPGLAAGLIPCCQVHISAWVSWPCYVLARTLELALASLTRISWAACLFSFWPAHVCK